MHRFGDQKTSRILFSISAKSNLLITAFGAVLLLSNCSPSAKTGEQPVQEITYQDLKQGASSTEWLSYGHDYGNQRFFPLDQINLGNVSRLVPVYVFQAGIAAPFETSPIVSNGIMYLSSAEDRVFAIDARTGRLIWRYQPLLNPHLRLCCGPVNRGVALGDGIVAVGRLDGKLVALDQYTGRVVWTSQVANNAAGYSITMAPLFYKGLILVGVAGGEFGIRGSLSAYSVDDGHLLWRWYGTDAQHWAGKFAKETPDGVDLHRDILRERNSFPRFANAWERGGASVWMTPAVDPESNTIFVTTGNPWPDSSADSRPGDNLFSDSIVALDGASGRLK